MITVAAYLLCLCIVTAPLGALLAYIKRRDAEGTIYESHLANATDLLWCALVVSAASVPLVFLFGLGVLIDTVLVLWLFARVIKGLGGAIEALPYERS